MFHQFISLKILEIKMITLEEKCVYAYWSKFGIHYQLPLCDIFCIIIQWEIMHFFSENITETHICDVLALGSTLSAATWHCHKKVKPLTELINRVSLMGSLTQTSSICTILVFGQQPAFSHNSRILHQTEWETALSIIQLTYKRPVVSWD